MKFFRPIGLLFLIALFYPLTPAFSQYPVKGRSRSTNVIDVRGGVECENPRNCVAGLIGECDEFQCAQLYNTGRCIASIRDGRVEPTKLCHVEVRPCDNTQRNTCQRMSFPVAVTCETLHCPSEEGPCINGKKIVFTGGCQINAHGPHQYGESCETKEEEC